MIWTMEEQLAQKMPAIRKKSFRGREKLFCKRQKYSERKSESWFMATKIFAPFQDFCRTDRVLI